MAILNLPPPRTSEEAKEYARRALTQWLREREEAKRAAQEEAANENDTEVKRLESGVLIYTPKY